MGTFSVHIEISNRYDGEFVPMEAMVDTGASYLMIPKDLLQRLGVRQTERRFFQLADHRTVEYDMGVIELRLDNRQIPVPVVFVPEGTNPLLGAVALEIFGLGVDPVGQKLMSVVSLT